MVEEESEDEEAESILLDWLWHEFDHLYLICIHWI